MSAFLRRELPGLALIALAIVFQASQLRHELKIGTLNLNDAVYHLTCAERLGQSFAAGEPFLDPWVSEWALGYPVWRSYQPLPHALAAAVLGAFSAPNAAVFAALQYAFLTLLPCSLYLGARLLGLGPGSAGLVPLMVIGLSESGDFGRFGLGYHAFVWRGSGLYTQLVALHLLAPTLGLCVRALDSGRRRPLAALALALTMLSHVIFGYVAFISAGLFALVGPSGARAERLVRLATICIPALTLLAWFVVPMHLSRDHINHSRFEPAYKWDSFGAPVVLEKLGKGEIFDAERAPILSCLIAVGALFTIVAWRDPTAQRLLSLATLWLLLFFGRATWGHLVVLAGVPAELHMHRLHGAFQLSAILVGCWGLARSVHNRRRAVRFAATCIVGLALLPVARERQQYLALNTEWGKASATAIAADWPDLEAAIAELRELLAKTPGRVSAGKKISGAAVSSSARYRCMGF